MRCFLVGIVVVVVQCCEYGVECSCCSVVGLKGVVRQGGVRKKFGLWIFLFCFLYFWYVVDQYYVEQEKQCCVVEDEYIFEVVVVLVVLVEECVYWQVDELWCDEGDVLDVYVVGVVVVVWYGVGVQCLVYVGKCFEV